MKEFLNYNNNNNNDNNLGHVTIKNYIDNNNNNNKNDMATLRYYKVIKEKDLSNKDHENILNYLNVKHNFSNNPNLKLTHEILTDIYHHFKSYYDKQKIFEYLICFFPKFHIA